jgi:hypothetical protein
VAEAGWDIGCAAACLISAALAAMGVSFSATILLALPGLLLAALLLRRYFGTRVVADLAAA